MLSLFSQLKNKIQSLIYPRDKNAIEVSQDKHGFDNDPEMQSILSDFQKLDFAKNPCNDPSDVIIIMKVKRQIHSIK